MTAAATKRNYNGLFDAIVEREWSFTRFLTLISGPIALYFGVAGILGTSLAVASAFGLFFGLIAAAALWYWRDHEDIWNFSVPFAASSALAVYIALTFATALSVGLIAASGAGAFLGILALTAVWYWRKDIGRWFGRNLSFMSKPNTHEAEAPSSDFPKSVPSPFNPAATKGAPGKDATAPAYPHPSERMSGGTKPFPAPPSVGTEITGEPTDTLEAVFKQLIGPSMPELPLIVHGDIPKESECLLECFAVAAFRCTPEDIDKLNTLYKSPALESFRSNRDAVMAIQDRYGALNQFFAQAKNLLLVQLNSILANAIKTQTQFQSCYTDNIHSLKELFAETMSSTTGVGAWEAQPPKAFNELLSQCGAADLEGMKILAEGPIQTPWHEALNQRISEIKCVAEAKATPGTNAPAPAKSYPSERMSGGAKLFSAPPSTKLTIKLSTENTKKVYEEMAKLVDLEQLQMNKGLANEAFVPFGQAVTQCKLSTHCDDLLAILDLLKSISRPSDETILKQLKWMQETIACTAFPHAKVLSHASGASDRISRAAKFEQWQDLLGDNVKDEPGTVPVASR